MESDLHILRELREGNRKPFEEFFKASYASFVKKSYVLVQNQETAEDIVQEVFLYVWKNHHKITLTDSMLMYVTRSVRNASLNYLKSAYFRNIDNHIPDEKPDNFSNQTIFRETEELKKEIRKAIRNLPPACRSIFLLSRFTEFTYAEIAEKLGVSVKTVEKQMSIALFKIRKSLEKSVFQLALLFRNRQD